MSSTYGENLHLTIFGQSHSPAIGVTVEGIPAGEKVDLDELQRFLNRRAPGKNVWSTPRKEADAPEILSGLVNGYTCGAPLTAIIRNTNTRSQDYANLAVTPRPGHADYTAEVKYGGYQDRAGGGHFSGRLTAPLCIAGGICLQILAREGITLVSRIASIAGISDEGELTGSLAGKEVPVVSDARGEEMREAIAAARDQHQAHPDDACYPRLQIAADIGVVAVAVGRRHQQVDIAPAHLGLAIAEQPLGGGAERQDMADIVDDHHGIGHGRQD